jgi:hypothetical protein
VLEAAAPIAIFLVGCAISGCSRRWLATHFAKHAYRRRRSTTAWKASCLVGSLWLALVVGTAIAVASALLKTVLALPAGADLLAPLGVGIIVVFAVEALRFRDAYWAVVHDSLERGLSAKERRESGFNGAHTRLTDGKLEERPVALKGILDAKSPQKTPEPADLRVPQPAVSSGRGPAPTALATQDKPTNAPPAATSPQQPRRTDETPNNAIDGDPPAR